MSVFLRHLCLLGALWGGLGTALLYGQTARDKAVELTAVGQENPRVITLHWNTAEYAVASQKVFRRLKNATNWSQIDTPANAATTYADSNVSVGVSYEYGVVRTLSGGPGTATGYVAAGIRVPLVADRGRVILLVDATMAGPLAAELARLISDLTGDGWIVVRQDVSRTATPASIRVAIQAIYNASSATTAAVILCGHVPVPYSGNQAIDGHTPDHLGAWPTDLYYGEMNGMWSDMSVNNAGALYPRNQNVEGDGKFDQTTIPNDIELQVGRIDFADMPAFVVGETELLRRYLNRDHAYRHKLGAFASVGRRALVDDDFFGFFGGEAFAATAWRSFTACVGAGNVEARDWFGTLQTESYLWAYGCGQGSYQGAALVGTTADFATKDSLAVFTISFGSYFGDWDNPDAYLRAPLAGTPNSLGLISVWAGRPHWFFHPMALGETAGFCARLTQNNRNNQTRGYDGNSGTRLNHVALLGDPTLRLYPVTPPANLTASVAMNTVTLNWSAPADEVVAGYFISRASSAAGPFVPLQSGLVPGTIFSDGTVVPGQSYFYLVRTVKLETSPTGSYFNSSQGVFSAAVVAGMVSGPEIDLSGNGNPITAGDIAALAANGTDYGSVEIPASLTRTFTVANVGTVALNISGVSITGAHAADFTVVAPPPATLAAGASAAFQIRFQPSAASPRMASVTLLNSDADEGSYQFALGGTGLPAHAEIAIYPPAINRSIHPGSAVTETLNLSNPAAGALAHTISSTLARTTARDSASFAGPAYGWVDIAGSGEEVPGLANADDVISGSIGIGFAFPFYGGSFTEVHVCSNGFLSFTDALNTSAANRPLPSLTAPANMIAPLWSDLVLDAGSHIYHRSLDGIFIVQFENMALYGYPNVRATFQVILQLNGEIFFQYKTLTGFGTTYTIGVQNGTGESGLLIAHNAAYVQAGMAVRFRPPGAESWLSLSATGGTVPPGGAQAIGVTLNATGLAPGDYFAELIVDSNALGRESVIIPVRFTIGNTPLENWQIFYFGDPPDSAQSADAANGDFDAATNLLEYALNRDPWVSETAALTRTEVGADGYLQLQFTRDATLTDLRYVVEATSDLAAGWTPIASGIHGAPVIATGGAQASVEMGTGEIKTVTVSDISPAAAFGRRFLRLRVERD